MPLLTPVQAAERLGVSRMTIYRYVKEGMLPCVRLGSTALRIDPADLDAFISARRSVA